MMARRSTKRRPRVVGVIASRADLERAVRMRRPPDLFELRLDRLAGMADQVEKVLPKLRTPLIITARDPREGGANKLRLRQRRDLLARFLNHADYIDVELRSARALRALLAIARSEKRPANHFIPRFQIDTERANLGGQSARGEIAWRRYFQSRYAHGHADGTRTFARVHDKQPCECLGLAVMGIGKLGAISRVLLARAGSVLIYASVGAATDVEGQLSLEQLRALGFGP